MSPWHENFVAKDGGLVINPSDPHLDASPDRFVLCDCCGLGALEIKCSYCVEAQSPQNAVKMTWKPMVMMFN